MMEGWNAGKKERYTRKGNMRNAEEPDIGSNCEWPCRGGVYPRPVLAVSNNSTIPAFHYSVFVPSFPVFLCLMP
jgi:hypothetical protein